MDRTELSTLVLGAGEIFHHLYNGLTTLPNYIRKHHRQDLVVNITETEHTPEFSLVISNVEGPFDVFFIEAGFEQRTKKRFPPYISHHLHKHNPNTPIIRFDTPGAAHPTEGTYSDQLIITPEEFQHLHQEKTQALLTKLLQNHNLLEFD